MPLRKLESAAFEVNGLAELGKHFNVFLGPPQGQNAKLGIPGLGGDVTFFQGDFFNLSKNIAGEFDRVWDR